MSTAVGGSAGGMFQNASSSSLLAYLSANRSAAVVPPSKRSCQIHDENSVMPSLSQMSFHWPSVTRSPNHMCAFSWEIVARSGPRVAMFELIGYVGLETVSSEYWTFWRGTMPPIVSHG